MSKKDPGYAGSVRRTHDFNPKALESLIRKRYRNIRAFSHAKGLSEGTVAAWLSGDHVPTVIMLAQALDGENVDMWAYVKKVE